MFGRELWIERTDYEETPPKGFFRLFPGNKVRLKYGHVIECTGATQGCRRQASRSPGEAGAGHQERHAGRGRVKVKGNITWVGVADGVKAEVRLYDRLFSVPQPDTGEKDFLEELNPDSLKVVTAYVEPSLAQRKGMRSSSSRGTGTSWRIGRITGGRGSRVQPGDGVEG
jgi:glutaminyl-tRNA synthetase